MDRITVKVREVYGNKLVYPVCDKAKVFAQIAGSRTLTEKTLKLIKKLGIGLVVATESLFEEVRG